MSELRPEVAMTDAELASSVEAFVCEGDDVDESAGMVTYAKWAAVTREQLERALGALEDDHETMDEVFYGIGLAEVAYRIACGEASEDSWPQDPEPVCICPPELLERGGFRGRCPAHGLGGR